MAILALGERDEREEQNTPLFRSYAGVLEVGLARTLEAQRAFDRAAFHYHRAAAIFADDQATMHDMGCPDFDTLKHEAVTAFRDAINIHLQEGQFSRAALLYTELGGRLEQLEDYYNAMGYYKRASELFRKSMPASLNFAVYCVDFALRVATKIKDVGSMFECLGMRKELLLLQRRVQKLPELDEDLVTSLVTEVLLFAHEGKFNAALHMYRKLILFVTEGHEDLLFSWSKDFGKLSSPTMKSKHAEVYLGEMRENGHLLEGLAAYLLDLLWTIEFREFDRFKHTKFTPPFFDALDLYQLAILDWIESIFESFDQN